jgi:hypothetical protein
MNTAVIVTQHGVRRADVIARTGDWAVTRYASDVSITHLPTGSRLPAVGTDAQLTDALADLAELPRFDLQTWEANRDAVKVVLRKHELVW